MTDNLEWLVKVEQQITDVMKHIKNYQNPEYQRPTYSSSKWFETETEAAEYLFMVLNSGYTAQCYHIDAVPGSTRNAVRKIMKVTQ
jgi:hypothetical protein